MAKSRKAGARSRTSTRGAKAKTASRAASRGRSQTGRGQKQQSQSSSEADTTHRKGRGQTQTRGRTQSTNQKQSRSKGSELWDLSLVDPDNRRLVDFARRRAMLGEIETRTLSPAMLMDDWPGAGFKLAAIYRLLALRRLRPALFAEGSYEPLTVSGEDADRAIAFLRRHEGALLCVVAGRFPSRGGFAAASFAVELPDGLPREDWHDLLSDETLDATAGLGNLGVRVLSREL